MDTPTITQWAMCLEYVEHNIRLNHSGGAGVGSVYGQRTNVVPIQVGIR